MKKTALFCAFLLLLGLFSGCSGQEEAADIAATTLPVYQFTSLLCEGSGLTVARLVTESVSCLHDYSLNVSQVKAVESADYVVINGAGLEDFMDDLLRGKAIIDASRDVELLEGCHDHDDEHAHEGHSHEHDAHIWLSAANASVMAENIYNGLREAYPQHADIFQKNWEALTQRLADLEAYAQAQLSGLSCRELITFHDGFAYLAQAYDLTILAALEEEAGSEVSAQGLIELIGLVRQHSLPAIFTEENGSGAAALTIARETGVSVYSLNMAMAGDDYFRAMYHNIDTIREALQ